MYGVRCAIEYVLLLITKYFEIMKNLLKSWRKALYILLLLVFSCENPPEKTAEITTMRITKTAVIDMANVDSLKMRSEYERGFRDALERLALLNLELDLKGERKTYGEMFDILYERGEIKH